MNNFPTASGLTYEQQQDLIEKVANTKAFQYKSIGFYDIEDLKQEVRIKCWDALPKFNPQEGTNMYVFLSICAENRIRDIKRSIMYKHNKPCIRCPYWIASAAVSGLHDCEIYDIKMHCDKYAKHERYVYAKLSASHPVDINSEVLIDDSYKDEEDRIDLVDYIETHLPSGFKPIFDKFKQNNYNPRSLRPRERSVIIAVLRHILSDYEV